MDVLQALADLAKALHLNPAVAVKWAVNAYAIWYLSGNLARAVAPTLVKRWPTAKLTAWVVTWEKYAPTHGTSTASLPPPAPEEPKP